MDTIIAEALDLYPLKVPEIVAKAKEETIQAAKKMIKTPIAPRLINKESFLQEEAFSFLCKTIINQKEGCQCKYKIQKYKYHLRNFRSMDVNGRVIKRYSLYDEDN
jgi:hypothetical protein